ncbi:hypothetical protein TNCV_3298281 [Trichonephila clavipes]|uniref:Uncharacterized protein n=1 Tax=Trichonephila clavipes TaxID=2585209 RepID=A0A8X7B783_TRICX|nr:hypothetical protein TNCV_3298281 [Trichonephila clavipes]
MRLGTSSYVNLPMPWERRFTRPREKSSRVIFGQKAYYPASKICDGDGWSRICVLVETHPISSATKKVVAKLKPKFESPYRVLRVQNNNVVIWKAGRRTTVNIDQMLIYHQRKSDEGVVDVDSSVSSGSEYQSNSFEESRPRLDRSQGFRSSESGER